jgi:hypothetical protein
MAFLLSCPAVAHGTPLDKEACGKLALEKQGLNALNVGKLMEKGPEWAAANLSLGDLSLIRRLIEVEEQIKFRCLPVSALIKLEGLTAEDDDIATEPDKPAAGASPAVVKNTLGSSGLNEPSTAKSQRAEPAPPLPQRKDIFMAGAAAPLPGRKPVPVAGPPKPAP